MIDAIKMAQRAGDEAAITEIFRKYIVLVSYVAGRNIPGVYPMGVIPGMQTGPGNPPHNWTGWNHKGSSSRRIVTITNYPSQVPSFDAYWCPYGDDMLGQVTLSGNASYMFTATMTGCTFAVGMPAGDGSVTVAHANAKHPPVGKNQGQAQRDLILADASFAPANALRTDFGPAAYRHAGAGDTETTKATTFGIRLANNTWKFYSQALMFSPPTRKIFQRGLIRI